jgi:hypothetical protein
MAGRPVTCPPLGNKATAHVVELGEKEALVVASHVFSITLLLLESEGSRLTRKELVPAVELVAGSRDRMEVVSL